MITYLQFDLPTYRDASHLKIAAGAHVPHLSIDCAGKSSAVLQLWRRIIVFLDTLPPFVPSYIIYHDIYLRYVKSITHKSIMQNHSKLCDILNK